jgi:hypothetical protein
MLIKRDHDKINFLEVFDFGKKVYRNLPPIRKRRRRKLEERFVRYFSVIFCGLLLIFFGWNFFVAKNLEPILPSAVSVEAGEIQNDNLTIFFSNSFPIGVQPKISKSFAYTIDQDINGFFSDLKLNYAYPGTISKKPMIYQDKVSIYTPKGSILVRADGFMDDKITIKEKNGRTVFEGDIVISQGEIANAQLNYKLPENEAGTAKCRKYGLTIRNPKNQPLEPLAVNLFFKKNIKDFSPSGFNVFAGLNSIIWETDLSQEMEFTVDFN